MATNPYSPPRAQVADVTAATDETQPIQLWSANGRIGRLRYLAYTIGAGLLVGFAAGVLTGILGREPGALVTLILYIPFIVFSFLSTIKRSHDMDWNGWTSLLTIIPFVGLVWLFKAGTPGENSYGPPPPPNTGGVKALAWIFPIVALLGILAAIALPAYQQYVQRSQAAQHGK